MAINLSRGSNVSLINSQGINQGTLKMMPKYGNCVNCGAVLKSSVCEYCGTEYATISVKSSFKEVKDNKNTVVDREYETDVDTLTFEIKTDDCKLDADLFAEIKYTDGKDEYVYYNNPFTNGVTLNKYDNTLSVRKSQVKSSVSSINIILKLYGKNVNFGMSRNLCVVAKDGNNNEIARIRVDEDIPYGDTALIFVLDGFGKADEITMKLVADTYKVA